MDTTAEVVGFGRHKDVLWSRVPVSYLKWMVNAGARDAEKAQAELNRRGTVTPSVDISGHAIDRASQRCLRIWARTRKPNEGLHAWLVRMSEAALSTGERDSQGRLHLPGLVFVFDETGAWPSLKTIMPSKNGA